MSPLLHESHRHADRILDVVARGARDDHTSDVVAHSWARCLNQYRLDPRQPCRPTVLSREELSSQRERLADVIDCARYEMTTLYQQLGDPESAVVLTNTDGVILHMVTSPEFERGALPLGLQVGAVWSEAEAGTNGMGTCVAAAAPIAVRLDEHFFTQLSQLTCSAVPVYDPAGEMCAVLDVTSRSQMPQQHLLVLLGMTARMIENRLIDRRFRDAHPIHFHSRPEFVYTLHEGKLVVDHEGQVLAANRSALFQLGLGSVREVRRRRLDEIFQTTLDDMLERSQRASFHPVVTYRANAAHRFFAVARLPAHEESPRGGLPDGEAPAARRVVLPARGGPAPGGHALGPAAPARAPLEATFGDARLQSHLATARRVIARGTPLLLCGETGVGKEVFARAVHAGSPRLDGPFVAINCASLPENLIEAELFGYRAGAFTGAERRGRRGKIAQADGGTLFLDEIGDMPLALQARLLRVLDERMVTPLGTDEAHPVDFQLLSASHRALPQLVAEGRFREDLYYRLAGIELILPPLRERSDRAQLIRDLLAHEGAPQSAISPAAWDLLMQHPWPGNVRQLRHVLRSGVALADGQTLTPEHLPLLRALRPHLAQAAEAEEAAGDAPALAPAQAQERQALLDQLEALRWNVSQVAKELGVSRNTLYRRMHRLHIPVTPPRAA
ncbi:sigma-54-dependent Fis family transcriptional regulator [Piscinibacter sakaiensis]|uniref:Transcriptional activator of acetoin/glycerol metabolism n=1 Tax=Piscinibacter sakaiensis TaxID=1547922 RepID=A0A0K8P683_PISS1|nr:sigma-54-dependent Fis family transcriptional regulator [Piscinibacter sakaiensis]GAP37715.1 transcriptional activator of acetoin/glycerol metabolism [Piscinibacter sakaiensis]